MSLLHGNIHVTTGTLSLYSLKTSATMQTVNKQTANCDDQLVRNACVFSGNIRKFFGEYLGRERRAGGGSNVRGRAARRHTDTHM